MSNKYESADLLLKLYEMRREPVMREARNWMMGFFPETSNDVMQAMMDVQQSAYFRMVVTYWDMACSFANHGAIDEEMFSDASGERVVVFAKVEPFLEEMRGVMNSPKYLHNLEKNVMKIDNAKEVLAGRREMMKRWMQARTEKQG
ncbi:MAG: hypothetical protein ABI954_14115 [Pyrinomonadaceae bacterium]